MGEASIRNLADAAVRETLCKQVLEISRLQMEVNKLRALCGEAAIRLANSDPEGHQLSKRLLAAQRVEANHVQAKQRILADR
jgi:hypothetical protein